MNELEAFHHFVGDQIANSGPALTPEECLDLWRAQNPCEEELRLGVEAIQEAINDMQAGDSGQSLEEFLAEFREKRRNSR
jgi:hypothetical protein